MNDWPYQKPSTLQVECQRVRIWRQERRYRCWISGLAVVWRFRQGEGGYQMPCAGRKMCYQM